jgi:hypothetical protein
MSRAAQPDLDDVPFGPPDVEVAPAPVRRNQITGKYAAQPIALLKSAPFRVLNNAERKMFTRIEIEYSDHYGRDNGKLPVTFDHRLNVTCRCARPTPHHQADGTADHLSNWKPRYVGNNHRQI